MKTKLTGAPKYKKIELIECANVRWLDVRPASAVHAAPTPTKAKVIRHNIPATLQNQTRLFPRVGLVAQGLRRYRYLNRA